MTGHCGPASEGMMSESGVIESDVEIPAVPGMALPVPAASGNQSDPGKPAPEVTPVPESLPEPKPSAAQVHKGPWIGIEPAQPYDLGIEGDSQVSATDDLGFNDSFDQMIEDSSSQILRCTSKEPVK